MTRKNPNEAAGQAEAENAAAHLTREQWELLERWDRLRAGTASAEEVAALHRHLAQDESARRFLAEAALLEAELRFDGESLVNSGSEGGAVLPQRPRRVWWQAGVAGLKWSHAAAAAAAVLVSWGVWGGAEPSVPRVATLVKAQSCKWGNSALPTLEGSGLTPGTLELVEGMATVRFDSGAEVVLEAPVSLEVVSAMEAHVRRGTVVADVPPQAKGFTIRTPETTVVDYGTRFGVSAGEDGKCLVHVIEGLVEVNRKGESGSRELRDGERVDYGGMLQAQLDPDPAGKAAQDGAGDEPGRWLPAAAMADLGDGWQSITTAFGRGRDSWIQSNPGVRVTGRESYLRVKHTTHDPKLERWMYLAFDLSRSAGRVAEAELVLHLEASELGFAALVPDATFQVYGLTDETGDEWSEAGLSWQNAPARGVGPEYHAPPDASKARLLGSFSVPQGRQSGAVTLRGEALAAFLRQDTNGVATLIVRRETDETARNGLVHAFASRENARKAPPMLRLRVE